MTQPPQGRKKLRYRWSHRHPVHRALVRTANRVLPRVPFALKYAATDAVRGRNLPYRLLTDGATAIQVGAPRDTLRSGRSRAMAFVRRTSPSGRVLVIEPDEASVHEFRAVAARHGYHNATVVHGAAWSEPTTLTMRIDANHPATNFTAGSTDYSQSEIDRFTEVEVAATPIDDLLAEHDFARVDLVSITTNGAESEILKGLRRTIERDRPYICLARTEASFSEEMTAYGYELVGEDDRGFTFRASVGADRHG